MKLVIMMNSDTHDLHPQNDKFMINQVLNSPTKRLILGFFFKFQQEFLQNTTWQPNVFKKLIKFAPEASKEIIKYDTIEDHFNLEEEESSLKLFIDLKILTANVSSSASTTSNLILSLKEFLNQSTEFHVITGIKFATDRHSSPSGGLELTLRALHTLLQPYFNKKISITKLQKALMELNGIPSRHSPGYLHFLVSPSSENVSKSSSKKKAFYHMNDPLYTFLNVYHPIKGKSDPSNTGSIFLDIFTSSLKLEAIVERALTTQKKAQDYLKVMDGSLILKNVLKLAKSIIKRELIIPSWNTMFEDNYRFPSFQEKLDSLANEGKLGRLIIKEANMTSHPLPDVFEFIDPYEQPLGAVDEWLITFSRLMVSFTISQTVSQYLQGEDFSLKLNVGDIIFAKIYYWLQSPGHREMMEYFDNLLIDMNYLTEFYSNKEQIEIIIQNFKESG